MQVLNHDTGKCLTCLCDIWRTFWTAIIDLHMGNHVHIRGNSVICPGITKGDGCAIGAGSVVTHDLPAIHVCAGTPTRVLRPITEADEEARAHMQALWEEHGGSHYPTIPRVTRDPGSIRKDNGPLHGKAQGPVVGV